MEPFGVSQYFQEERNRWANKINRESWKFEHIEQPARRRMKVALLREMIRG